jgi:hypothetical protein
VAIGLVVFKVYLRNLRHQWIINIGCRQQATHKAVRSAPSDHFRSVDIATYHEVVELVFVPFSVPANRKLFHFSL